MREELGHLIAWQRAGKRFALAVVVATSNSAPRDPGACMAVDDDGEVVGSISGGCVEGDVVEVAHAVLRHGRPVRRRYGIADADAMAVGLTCGGEIDVFVHAVEATDPALTQLAAHVDRDEPVALATIVGGRDDGLVGTTLVVREGRFDGGTGHAALDGAIARFGEGALAAAPTTITLGREGERLGGDVEVFVHPITPPPRMIVFGATDFTAALASLGHFVGYRVTVCDARAAFATAARFPDADEVVVDWPHRYLAATDVDARTVLCVLTHDEKFEIPLLEVALGTDAGYIGAMGSRRTDERRRRRLVDAGVAETDLERLHSPIGLDLGAATPHEVAISIVSEIIGARTRASGAPLSTIDGPIHRRRTVVDA